MIAFCPAAWTDPGVTGKSPICGGMPTAIGKTSAGADCSIADNCGMGWHVCGQIMGTAAELAAACAMAPDLDFWSSSNVAAKGTLGCLDPNGCVTGCYKRELSFLPWLACGVMGSKNWKCGALGTTLPSTLEKQNSGLPGGILCCFP